jgi:hypothetical protein
MLSPHPVADRVKAHPAARCLTVTRANRDACLAEATTLLRKITGERSLSS